MTPEQSHIEMLEERIKELEAAHRSVGLYYLLRGIHRVSQWALVHKGEPIEAGLNYAVLRLNELAEEVKCAAVTPAEFELARDWPKSGVQ
jgi:hypothetical protein